MSIIYNRVVAADENGNLPPKVKDLLKGDPGKPGHWTKDAQAKAQGYWIVVSPTEPESGTYTTADGTVVPVIWQKPIEVLVPVIPEAPYFDKYALSIQVASLVGVDYYLTGFTKDGATVDVPDVKIEGRPLKMDEVVGVPSLPYNVNVEARAKPGYRLPSSIKWSYAVVDPKEVVLFTSDTFTGRNEGSPLFGTTTDATLGGKAKTWNAKWERGSGDQDAMFKVATDSLVVRPGPNGAGSRAAVGILGVGVNQRVEFDLTFSADAKWSYNSADGLLFHLAGAPSGLGGGGSLLIPSPQGTTTSCRIWGPSKTTKFTFPAVPSGQLSGHYVLELFEKSAIFALPRVAPVTIDLDRVAVADANTFSIESAASLTGSAMIDNLKISTIGF